jgi:hypothetical protein
MAVKWYTAEVSFSAIRGVSMIGIRPREDVLVQPMERLELLLQADFPGRELCWAQGVSVALAGVEHSLLLHTSFAENADGLLVHIDLTRPTLARRVSQLRQEHRQLSRWSADLQHDLRDAVLAFRNPGTEIALPRALPELPGPAKVLDLGAIRHDLGRLLQSLHHHVDDEAQLILESVNTDIGVGD